MTSNDTMTTVGCAPKQISVSQCGQLSGQVSLHRVEQELRRLLAQDGETELERELWVSAARRQRLQKSIKWVDV
jgi:adenine C2-methylase RlmN of 23S rRNA A2503 and tRNA A37